MSNVETHEENCQDRTDRGESENAETFDAAHLSAYTQPHGQHEWHRNWPRRYSGTVPPDVNKVLAGDHGKNHQNSVRGHQDPDQRPVVDDLGATPRAMPTPMATACINSVLRKVPTVSSSTVVPNAFSAGSARVAL